MRSNTHIYVQSRFGQADRIKIGKKTYTHDLEESYLSGYMTALEWVLNQDAQQKFETKDDLLAALHIETVEAWNRMHKLNPKYIPRKDLNDILEKIYGEKVYDNQGNSETNHIH